MSRPNQRSIYLNEENLKELEAFQKRYPIVDTSAVANAALRRYFEEARAGVDGNLEPIGKKGRPASR